MKPHASTRPQSRNHRYLAALSAGALIVASIAATGGEMTTAVCIGVVSGDTLEVRTDAGPQVIRLWGIDAPELDQPYGPESRQWLAESALEKTFDVEILIRLDDLDVAVMRSAEGDLAKRAIEAGFAWLSMSSPTSDEYATALFLARGKRAGMWADPEVKHVHPTEWIARQQPTPTPTPTPTPASLSAIAPSVKLANQGQSGAITDSDLASAGLSLPDSDYSRCVVPVVSMMESAVKTIRHLTTDGRIPVDQGDLTQLRHAQEVLISGSEIEYKLSRCSPGSSEWQGHRHLSEAASLYKQGAKEVYEDVAQTWILFNAGDEKMRVARAAYNQAYADKIREEVEANNGQGRRRY